MNQNNKTLKWIEKAKLVHGNKYDYSKVVYKKSCEKVIIICKEHNEFEQIAAGHLRGNNCKKCATKNVGISQKTNILDFINRSNIIHNNKYDYSKVVYKNSDTKVIFICLEHGEFEQLPSEHLKGRGCKKCGIIKNSKNNTNTTINWIKKAKLIHENKYDYSKIEYIHSEQKLIIICPEHGEFEQIASNHLRGYGCKQCFYDKKLKSKEQFIIDINLIHGDKYDYSKVNYINSKEKIIIICPEHGEFEQTPNNHLSKKSGCSSCSSEKTISKSEQEIYDFIKSLGIDNIEQSNRKILNNQELDIYLPDHKLSIEFNGLYWHNEDYKDNNYHLLKTEECLSKGIQLIHIFEDEWINKKDIVKSRLINLLHKIKKDRRIYARKCVIKEIDSSIARSFTERNHLQGFVGAKVHLGLFFTLNNKEYMVSYMSFGNLRKNLGSKNDNDKHYELLRFCNVITYNVIGGASKLLKYFEKKYLPEKIISYADRRWSNGNLYNQLGFTQTHKSKPNYYYVEGIKRHNRFGYRKDILISKYNCKPEMTEKEFCRDVLGLKRIYDAGNLVYEK